MYQPQTLPPTSWAVSSDKQVIVTDFAGPCFEQESVDAPVKKFADGTTFGDQKLNKANPKSILLGLTMLVLFLLVLIPCWNCVGLLDDDLFMFMTGPQTAAWLLSCCIIYLLLCFVSLVVFCNRSRPEARTEQTMLMIAGIFLSALGITLILFGDPLQKQAQVASAEFTSNCKMGPKTSLLFAVEEELGSLRATPGCAARASIEDCDGYSEYITNTAGNAQHRSAAMVLKAMEGSYKCSGFCDDAKAGYPPTLFSKANYKVSCDGMAARRIRNFAEAIGSQTMMVGCMLVAVALIMSFGQLLNFCGAERQGEVKAGKSYGATL